VNRIWKNKKASLDAAAEDFARRSPVLELFEHEDMGDEWRSAWLLLAATLVRCADGTLMLAGPIALGIRYHESYLAQAPHPWEIATVIQPRGLFHPNATPSGSLCLGHPEAGVSLEYILNQAWAALTFNMKSVNTRSGEILNLEAARFVRANASRFPLTDKGLFEKPDFQGPLPSARPF
jgi:hypothetical protein